ncbi:sugar phosphate isomerase/epimerase [Devosia algicola]|uniref:Sugar phosphate isomerase/epimerase n=1 Tax=Devosia algicola TaxID=3026418 RepID=A0ABY7YRJ9_9HYPH|nr:sugar phosphate isomerase/epimerase family protein [Devosia algicola]WDR03510.1 sugar phosphate isomerase/epimerase [Devosia algicola]
MKTCFNTITAGLDRRLEDIIAACTKSGFDGMELDLRAIDEAASRLSINDIRQRLADGGLAAVSVMAFDLAPFAVDGAALDRFKRGAAVAQEVGAPILLTFCFAPVPEGMSEEAALEVAGKRAALYAEVAGPTKIALEPIGRAELMGGPVAALDIARRTGSANVGVMMDTFHYYLSQVPDADVLKIPLEKLFIVHVNDSEDRPIAELKDAHRMHVGEGILPLNHDLELLRKLGYDGYLSVEIFREQYWKQPVEQVVADAKSSLDLWLGTQEK